MYTETNKAGVKSFFFILIAVITAMLVLSCVKSAFENVLLVDAVTILIFCIIGYYTLVRYSSVFEYSTDGEVLIIIRKIGHRVTTVNIDVKKIKKLSRNKADISSVKKPLNMCASIISKQRAYYLLYTEDKVKKAIIFEPTDALVEKLKRGKGTKND